MTQTAIETDAAVKYAILVTLSFGDTPTVYRYCRWDSDLTVDAQVFTAEPTLDLVLDKAQHGGTDDAPIEVLCRSTLTPFDRLVQPRPHARVSVTVEEVIPGDDTSRQVIYKGTISKVTVKAGKNTAIARATVVSPKSKLQALLGMQALSTCLWAFGSEHCGYDLVSNTITNAVISSLSQDGIQTRILVTINESDSSLVVTDALFWNRGYVEVDGLRISIRKAYVEGLIRGTASGGESDDNQRETTDGDIRILAKGVTMQIELRNIPPSFWAGQACKLVPGCDKQIATCRYHGQESQFSGFGLAMPDRNPVFEQ